MKKTVALILALSVGVSSCSRHVRQNKAEVPQPTRTPASAEPAAPLVVAAAESASCVVNGDTPPPPPGFAPREAICLAKGQMLLIDGPAGTAIIEFTEFGEKFVSYRWRARARNGLQGRGNGTLVERYAPSPDNPGRIIDVGSDLLVGAGFFAVEWSYASVESAWLYPDRALGTSRVVSSAAFDTFPLAR